MTTTIPAAKLPKLNTVDLIAQYDLAISSNKGRYTNTAPRQKRINFIVDMLSERADNNDVDAIDWFKS